MISHPTRFSLALLARTPEARLRLGIVLYAQGRPAPARREWTRVLHGVGPDAARRARRLLIAYPRTPPGTIPTNPPS